MNFMPAKQPFVKSPESGLIRPPMMEVGANNYFSKEDQDMEDSPAPVDERERDRMLAPTVPAAFQSQAHPLSPNSQATHDKQLKFNNELQYADPLVPPMRDQHAANSEVRTASISREGTVQSHAEAESHSPDEDGEGYFSKSDAEGAVEGSHGQPRSKRRMTTRGSLYRRHSIAKKFKVHKQNEMGEIVDKKGHRAWEMACGLQLGIRVNVGMNQNVPFASTPEFDTFHEAVKLKFPPAGSSITPPHEGAAFKFKDYAPVIFRNLREVFKIDTADYLVALCNTQPDGSNALRIMGTPGKSGSLFFFSNDMRFIVKTLPKREALLLREILPAYYQHVKQNPGTYLPRFYGLHRWKPEYGRNVRFVVMNNVFATNMPIHRRFDLKGSTMGRSASASDKEKGHRCILKDLDFLELNDNIKLGSARKRAFLDQIRRDCHLLMSLKIMDYSLLLGVHFEDGTEGGAQLHQPSMEELIPPANHRVQQPGSTGQPGSLTRGEEAPDFGRSPSDPESIDNPASGPDQLRSLQREDSQISRTHHGQDDEDYDNPGVFHPGGVRGRKEDGTPVGHRYFIGIIDILMLYTRRKKMERVWKTMTEGEGASSQPPAKYAIRFCKFVESIAE